MLKIELFSINYINTIITTTKKLKTKTKMAFNLLSTSTENMPTYEKVHMLYLSYFTKEMCNKIRTIALCDAYDEYRAFHVQHDAINVTIAFFIMNEFKFVFEEINSTIPKPDLGTFIENLGCKII
jgi:hypothetical protein